nr:hypothetical protein [uncultured Vibrio sp.]
MLRNMQTLAIWGEEHDIELEFIQPGRATQNGFDVMDAPLF